MVALINVATSTETVNHLRQEDRLTEVMDENGERVRGRQHGGRMVRSGVAQGGVAVGGLIQVKSGEIGNEEGLTEDASGTGVPYMSVGSSYFNSEEHSSLAGKSRSPPLDIDVQSHSGTI